MGDGSLNSFQVSQPLLCRQRTGALGNIPLQ
jgi:hypothetical protein